MGKAMMCSLASLEDGGTSVVACLNPRELSIDKSVPWNEQRASKGDRGRLEFTDAAPAVLTVELTFDTYEAGESVHTAYVARLEKLAQVIEPGSRDPRRNRPPHCQLVWGDLPPFAGVVVQLTVKYTMFFSDGTPCRAVATVRMKELHAPPGTTVEKVERPPRGAPAAAGDALRADRFGDDHRAALDAAGSEDGRLRPGQAVPGRPDGRGAW